MIPLLRSCCVLAAALLLGPLGRSQSPAPPSATPAYPTLYGPASAESVSAVLKRLHGYLASVTPARLVDRQTRQPIEDPSASGPNAGLASGDFKLLGYEWGVTYAGMLLAGRATGDPRFTSYVAERFKFFAELEPIFRPRVLAALSAVPAPTPARVRFMPMSNLIAPRSLDDCGAICAAMIQATRAGVGGNLRPYIDTAITHITSRQYRLPDGTLARNRPLPNSLWLDDLYMSVPALAQMGRLTGDRRYTDDAIKQVLHFSARMFIREKGLYLHGWVQSMPDHPAYHWARANGWALMACAELLDGLAEDYPGRAQVLDLYRAQVRGLAACQSGQGLWHQLLDRPDSYLETSASAIFVYGIARGINRGWLDPLAYGPVVTLGWNAVAQKVNPKGQVEGTCVGTGMGFDPAFYYYRPTSTLAAHGYGPVLLAGAEMIQLGHGKGREALISDGAVQFRRSPVPF